MNENQQPPETSQAPFLLSNSLSLVGTILAICSFLTVLALMYIDSVRGFANPYMSVFTYQIVPGGLITGLLLIVVGVRREHRRRHAAISPGPTPLPRIDLNVPRQRRAFVSVVVVTFLFLIFTAIGTYRTYHFTESVQFCGLLCHSVMKPEYTLYMRSPHARVVCTECHVGPGASWFVQSKISGMYQIYSTMAEKHSRPIPTPIENLRPARETCEECHWPQKFSGSVERVRTHFRPTEKNDPWTIRLLLKVGGGDPTQGPVTGIHWHMSPTNRVEYIATDKARHDIPWVKVTEQSGAVTVYEIKGKKLSPADTSKAEVRLMDCLDCHNRPTHIYQTPNKAMDTALLAGRIDPIVPFIKKNAVQALMESTKNAKTEAEGLAQIETKLKADYATYQDQKKVQSAIAEVKSVFSGNIFPEMKANWRSYPDNIGHSLWPGCIRCHDGEHVSADGKTISHECNACHIIIGQGPGREPAAISAKGLEFDHPGGEIGKDAMCSNCHSGALVE